MTVWLWAGFVLFVLVMLALDLGLVNRRAHVVSAREAIGWTVVCVALALAFAVLIFFMYRDDWLGIGVNRLQNLTGREAVEQYLAGWLVEYSLSLDNIFVMAVVFRYFRVPLALQHRVLFWGVLGALVMRGAMIGAGAAIISAFHWVEYLLGLFLIYTALRMLLSRESEPEPERGWVVRAARRLAPMTPDFVGTHFFIRDNGRRMMTPLFLVLLVIETTDVVFAVDSIPAIFGITHDAFLVFTSNIFAILGLRSLYFGLAAVIGKFRYLKASLVVVLAFVGLKMLVAYWWDMPTWASLASIVVILGTGLIASVVAARGDSAAQAAELDLAAAAELAWKRARRIAILVVGLTIIFIIAPLTGLLPGPGGIPVAIAGLALLATEFVWAKKILDGLKARARALAARADVFVGARPRLWLVALVIALYLGTVSTLLWVEPRWAWTTLLGSAGPGIGVAYWAWLSVRRWRANLASPPHSKPGVEKQRPAPESGTGPVESRDSC